MTEESIRRPKGRRGSTGDTEQPEHKRKGFSLGKRMGSSEPVGMPEDPMSTEEPKTQESRFYSASINLGGAPARDQTPSEPQRDTPIETAHEEPAPEAPDAKKRFGFSKKEEDRKGTWGDTGYHATDEEAHRDRRYRIPSFVTQTGTMFMVQMRLYSKMKWTYFMLFMAILIPIITIVLDEVFDAMAMELGSSTAYIGMLLSMMPIVLGFFTAVLSGPSIGREFKDRTAYMSMPLPISRVSFYLGKYLAGFVLSLGIFMFAYGMAVATAMSHYDYIFADLIGESMLVMTVSLFAYSATAFCIGAFTRKPSTLTPFVLMTFVLPAVLMIIHLRYDVEALMLLPCFLPDVTVSILGSPIIGSVSGFFSMAGVSLVDVGELWTMVGIAVVWGIVFLLIGMVRTMRREM